MFWICKPRANEGGLGWGEVREERRRSEPTRQQDPDPCVLRPGLALALSAPRGQQHPRRDARLTPGRRAPPSAPPAAAPSSFASPPPPQPSGGRAGSRRAGEPWGVPSRGRAAGAARGAGPSPDRRQPRSGRLRLGLAQSPVSYTTSSRSEQPPREDVQQPSSLQPLGIFR